MFYIITHIRNVKLMLAKTKEAHRLTEEMLYQVSTVTFN